MLTVCYSAKGGQGCTTVAAMLAVLADRAVLVDGMGTGDLPAVLGLAQPECPGLTDVLVAGKALHDIPETPLCGRLSVVAYGNASLDGLPQERWTDLAAAMTASPVLWVLDAGTGAGRIAAGSASHALLVTRYCYLALRRVSRLGTRPTGVIGVHEEGRSLDDRDLERVVGAPVIAKVPCTAEIARAIDAGLLGSTRLPGDAERALTDVLKPPMYCTGYLPGDPDGCARCGESADGHDQAGVDGVVQDDDQAPHGQTR